MFDFHEKRKIRRIVYSKVFIGAVFLLAFLLGTSVYERYTIEREMAGKLEDRMKELRTLGDRAALLESKVDHLKNERGIEEELRTRFDVAKEGEQVVIIIDDSPESKGSATVLGAPVPKEDPSFLERMRFWRD